MGAFIIFRLFKYFSSPQITRQKIDKTKNAKMKKIILLCFFFSIGMISLQAQDKPANAPAPPAEDTVRPYLKHPTLPAFNIRLMDSVTIFNTYNIPEGKPTAIIFFDPDCKHCRTTMTRLLSGMDSIKNIQFYLVTPRNNMTPVRNFYAEFKLADYKNIQVLGRDYEYFFFGYYKTKFFPDIALYDEHKKLVKLIEGEFTASDLYKLLH